MKFKYYLRGIGIGIIFASIIFLVAYHDIGSDNLTNDEIIERAKQLGMVEANDPINKIIDSKQSEASSEQAEIDSEAVKETASTQKIEVAQSTETTEEATEEPTEEPISSEATEEVTEESATSEATEKDTEEPTASETTEKDSDDTVELTVIGGSSSFPVCQKLQELGVIDDAAKFDDFLIENGYANRISVGTHKLKKGMNYKEIAELISDPL